MGGPSGGTGHGQEPGGSAGGCTGAGLGDLSPDEAFPAEVIAQNKNADLVILKVAKRNSACLPIASSDAVRMGASVATVGFPRVVTQGFAPKLASGEIASLAGYQDEPRVFQISVPLQPGNSGGPLVDAKGNVVGVVCAILNQQFAIAKTGTTATLVSYAVKSNLLMDLVESVPGLSDELPQPGTQQHSPEEVAAEAQRAAVFVVVK